MNTENQNPENQGQSQDLIVKRFSYLIMFFSFAGAVGVALQNVLAMVDFLKTLGNFSLAFLYGISGAFGGFCGGLVNLLVNVDLLIAFLKRLSSGKILGLHLNAKNRAFYWMGILIFITTGVLFGMTALAFVGSGSVLTILGITAGILVAVIMTMQEWETWAEWFDKKASDEVVKITNTSRAFSIVFSLVNVFALSSGFALGLATVLGCFGVAPLTAIIIALAFSFTIGAATEFFFYQNFMAGFFNDFKKKWQDFFANPGLGALGLLSISINAGVNGVLCYTGMLLLDTLLIGAGLSVIPIPAIVVAAVFCGAVSFILGANFWIGFAEKIMKAFTKTSDKTIAKEADPKVEAPVVNPRLSGEAARLLVAGTVVHLVAANDQPKLKRTGCGLFSRAAAYQPLPAEEDHTAQVVYGSV